MPPATHSLVAAVRLQLDVFVTPPFDAVPGPLLGSAGGLVVKLLLQVSAEFAFRRPYRRVTQLCILHAAKGVACIRASTDTRKAMINSDSYVLRIEHDLSEPVCRCNFWYQVPK